MAAPATAPKNIECLDCHQTFEFSVSEQEFYASRGFGDPKRCRECRQQRRGGAPQGDRRGAPQGNQGPRQMYPATCAQCQQPTQIPFQPRDDRPVYCRDCFRARQ
eukprot:m51a1_g6517 hypothetical protein (105) ;mRNA; r:272417-272986